MAFTTNTNTMHQVRNHTIGQVVTDAATAVDATFVVGYTPRAVHFINITDGSMLEWYEGMADNSAVQTTAAGARSLITTNGITANATLNGFSLKAASLLASKTYRYETIG